MKRKVAILLATRLTPFSLKPIKYIVSNITIFDFDLFVTHNIYKHTSNKRVYDAIFSGGKLNIFITYKKK
jgi:CTP:phosphocholine cytidylyltransferase-like protein